MGVHVTIDIGMLPIRASRAIVARFCAATTPNKTMGDGHVR
jgi:hypothetical protein